MDEKTLYDDGTIRVYTYGAGEIFVRNLASYVTARIGSSHGTLRVTTQNGLLTPHAFNGLSAFVVQPLPI